MSSFSPKKLILLGLIATIFAAIPLTLYLLHRQQQTQSGAVAATTITFNPASATMAVGDKKTFDIVLDPGNKNQVSFVKLKITYDSTRLQVTPNGLVPSNALPSVLQEATVSQGSNGQGTATIILSAGADPTKIVSSRTTIATITFQAIASSASPLTVAFDQPNMQVLSAGSDSASNENVLSTVNPATITVSGISGSTTPTVNPTSGGSVTTNPTTQASSNPPICTALNIDRSTSGQAPYSVTFTAIGNSSTSTISKVTFNFGDGPLQDVTTGGNIGTSSISVQASHTYVNPGNYTATAILTDNTSATSSPSSCTQTIVVTTAGSTTTANPTSVPIVTLAQNPSVTSAVPTSISSSSSNASNSSPIPQRPVSGPGETFIGLGAIGATLSIVGVALFFIL